jgi:hypothetical protein
MHTEVLHERVHKFVQALYIHAVARRSLTVRANIVPTPENIAVPSGNLNNNNNGHNHIRSMHREISAPFYSHKDHPNVRDRDYE